MNAWRYEYQGELWRVTKPEQCAAEFGGVPEPEQTLPRWHAALCPHPRSWAICRRLFGWHPVIPPLGARPEEFVSASAEETAREFGLSRAQLRAELDTARGILQACQAEEEEGEAAALPTGAALDGDGDGWFATAQQTLDLNSDAVFERYAITPPKIKEDRDWLSARLLEWRKLLDQPQTRPLAEATLNTMMQVRRLQRELAETSGEFSDDKERTKYLATLRVKTEQEEHLQQLLTQVDKVAPWFGAVAGKVNLVGVMGEFVRARQEFYAKGDRTLADGIFTLTEIELECRTSVEKPVPQYRAGAVMFLNQAKANLWNPNWVPDPEQVKVLRRLDRAFQAAIVEAAAADGVKVPELKSLDTEEEYEPLRLATLGESHGKPKA